MTPEQLPLTKQDLREALDAAIQTLTARQESSMEALTLNLSDLRRELMEYLQRLENRTERTEINVSALLMQTAGISKSLSVLERSDGHTATTQAAHKGPSTISMRK